MTIQTLKEDDLPGCAALFVEVFSAPPWNENWNASTATRRFNDCWRTPGFFGLLAQSEEQLVGFALGCVEQWNTSRHFHLREMCVALEMQRRGVGSELMHALEDHLREAGVGKIILHTARESDAQTFYDRCGFHTSARMVMMSKRLTAPTKGTSSMSSTSSSADINDWNRIAEAYAQAAQPDDFVNRQFKTVLWECLGDVRDLDVLDLGCGAGWLSKQLHEQGARVVGVDGALELIERARADVPGARFLAHDLAQGLPPGTQRFERIVANMVMMDIPDLSLLMRDVREHLEPSGKFVFTMQHPCFFNIKSHRDEEGLLFKKLTGYLQPETWRMEGFGGHNHYHRSLTFYFDLLRDNSLAVTRFYEPPHVSATQRPEADARFFENIPIFLLIEAVMF